MWEFLAAGDEVPGEGQPVNLQFETITDAYAVRGVLGEAGLKDKEDIDKLGDPRPGRGP